MADGGPQAKKSKHSIISEHIFSAPFKKLFCKHWNRGTEVHTENLEITNEPFRVCRMSNFLRSEDFMEDLKIELYDVRSRRHCMDLYQYEQTDDLSKVDRRKANLLFEAFQNEMAPWMEFNTNVALNGTISMSSACFSDADYLLCHDDNLGDRRIAFILYLTKNWEPEDGGTLDLYAVDEKGYPTCIVKSLLPKYNSLVFFEVAENTYHRVAEITAQQKPRWTISGWFHGVLDGIVKPVRPDIPKDYVLPVDDNIELNSWVEGCYLTSNIVKQIQQDIEEESYAMLANFIDAKVYETLSDEITVDTISWKKVGPPDERNYEIADEETLPKKFKQFYNMFKSKSTFSLLKDYTELDLVKQTDDMNPRMTIELQRFSTGCYTLLSDRSMFIDTTGFTADDSATVRDTDESMEQPETPEKSSVGGRTPVVSPVKETRPKEKDEKGNKDEPHGDVSKGEQSRAEPEAGGSTSLKDAGDKERKSLKRPLTDGPQEASASKEDPSQERAGRSGESEIEDSEVSDIGDYLSDHAEGSATSSERVEEPEEPPPPQPGALDVIIQFHTQERTKTADEYSIDYIDSSQAEGALIHIAPKDNHLYLVYRTAGVCRVHKYVNHYCTGYFYNLVCTYYE